MAIGFIDRIAINNPNAEAIVDAKEVGGHKSVATPESLYSIPDPILSLSKNNTNNDAIGQLWYVVGENKFYQLVDWANRHSELGWVVFEVHKAIYTIEPSVNSIHLSSKGLNTSILDVWVNIDGSSHIKVDDQSMLDRLGMSVWYSIDDDTKRHKLIVGGSFIMETEDGDAILVAEDADDINDDNLIITLESESIDISSIKDKINLHLILNADANGYGEELNRIYIPVTKDGGHLRAITIIEPSTINQYLTGASIDIDKCNPYIRFVGSFSIALPVVLPSIPDSTDYFNVRQHIGSIVCIYNNSGSAISINGRCKQNETTLLSNVSITPNNFGYFVCKCTVTEGKEDVYWETRVGAMYN